MIEPLSLKSEPNLLPQAKTGGTISASQLISQFNLRSPTNIQVCLTDRIPQTCKSTSSLKINNNINYNFKRTKPKGEKMEEYKPNIKSILTTKNKHKMLEDIFQHHNSKQKINKQKEDSIIKQEEAINPVKKQKNPKLTLPLHKILQNKENIGSQTERTSTPLSTKRSHALKTNINLLNRQRMTVSIKHQKEDYFRKSSDASTLSLRTKHANSIQHFDEEDSDQLFNPSDPSTTLRNQPNLIGLLEQTKKKLYQQIYSLDKKLIKHQQFSSNSREPQSLIPSKKTIVINIKKKSIPHHNKSCKDLLDP